MQNTDLNEQEVSISFADLPATCFINPEDRPLGTLVSLASLAKKNYAGLKLGKATPGAPYTEPTNLIKILTKKRIHARFLLGETQNNIHIDKEVSGGFDFSLWYHTNVFIGAGTTANALSIEARRGTISIGQQCMISEAWIQATDMHGIWSLESKKPLNKAGFSVTIEDGVWVGRRSSIIRPVTVGKGSIIAFGAVVTKDVPRCSIVAGNPAAVTKRNITWTRHFKDAFELEQRISTMGLDA
ncbi:MAG TPA: acyltransferase, partial [Thiolinea sp.]|nr:acyltransferase [Thiolinea sp.]